MKIYHSDIIQQYQLGMALGKGHYSNVHSVKNKPLQVIKINNIFDPTYYYLKWSMEEPKPWKPKVYSLFKTKDEAGYERYVCIMRKYQKSDRLPLNQYYDEKEKYEPYIEEFLNKNKEKWDNKHDWDVQTDIHRNNVMVHYTEKKEQLIITDPFYSTTDV